MGLPLDGDTRAAGAVLHPYGAVELRRVGYKAASSAAASRERNPAFGEIVARRIGSARFDL